MTDSDTSSSNFGRPDPVPRPQGEGAIPIEIGGYRIQRVLGSGGMATVFAALQTQPRRTVALKIMKAGMAKGSGDTARRRFTREIEILGKLHHPYIAQVYGAGLHNDAGGEVPYFVMEYVPGAKNIIEHIVAREFDLRERLKLFVKVCAAIEHGHKRKIIHRDIKPGNILIDEYGEPKVIDFGVAHAADIDVASQTLHEETGRLVGTLKYMAPEQVADKPVDLDARCDVYALGVMLYKIATGRLPHEFEGVSIYEAVRVIREKTPPPPSAIKPELRGDLETIILTAINPDRRGRYRDAGALGRDIMRYLSNKPIKARRAGAIHRARLFVRRRKTPLVVAGIGLSIMLLAASILIIERVRVRNERLRNQADRTEIERSQEALAALAAQAAESGSLPPTPVPDAPYSLREHTGAINQLAFVHSAKGDRLVSASDDHTVVIWDLAKRSLRVSIEEFDRPVTQVACNPGALGDSEPAIIAAVSQADPIQLFELTSGRPLRTIRHGSGVIQSLALSRAGDRLAYAGEDFTLRLMPLGASNARAGGDSGRTLRSTTGAFTAIAFSPDGAWVAAGSQQGDVTVWSVQDGRIVRSFGVLREPVSAIAFLPVSTASAAGVAVRIAAIDGAGNAFTAGVDQQGDAAPITFNTLRGAAAGERRGWGRPTFACAAFSEAGNLLAVATSEAVVVWDLSGMTEEESTGADIARPAQRGSALKVDETPRAVSIDRDARWCAVGYSSGDIAVLPVDGRK